VLTAQEALEEALQELQHLAVSAAAEQGGGGVKRGLRN
jgi:hypothetical protein